MNLYDLLQDNKSLNITINAGQLIEVVDYCIIQTKQQLEEAIISDKLENYLGAQQVCEMLGINMSTLWRWENKAYLIPSKVGGKRRFKYSEVKRILEGGRKK